MDSQRNDLRLYSFGKFVNLEVRGMWPAELMEPMRNWLNTMVVKTLDTVIETRRVDLLGGNPVSVQTSGCRADLNGIRGSTILSPELESALENLCIDPLNMKNAVFNLPLPPPMMTTTRVPTFLEAQQNDVTCRGSGGVRPMAMAMQQNTFRSESQPGFLGLDSHLTEPNYSTNGTGDKNDFRVMTESVKTDAATSYLQWSCVRGPCQCSNSTRDFDRRDSNEGVNGNLGLAGLAQLQVPPMHYGSSVSSVPKTPSPEKPQQSRNVFETSPGGHNNRSTSNRSHRRDASYCPFCKSNGSNEDFYSSHQMRENGKIVCPILRRRVCVLCKATGDNAHTIKYCPCNEKGFYASAAVATRSAKGNTADSGYLTGSPEVFTNDDSFSYVKSSSFGMSELSSPSLDSLPNDGYGPPRFNKLVNGREMQYGAAGSVTCTNVMSRWSVNEDMDDLRAKIVEEQQKRLQNQQFGFQKQ